MTNLIVVLGVESFVATLDWVDLLEGLLANLVDLVEGLDDLVDN